ncbi:MAG: Type 4 prepilin-like protein leader peptide-processing enzyme [candidate division TM6 bacterium GW2011_GWE2_31_21]|nr:MAG: Type 4 prepilin-like protein leader peptide-processing enzyme [candidate division TM6 bacterium GW2011_GWE2_31_21]KKP53172.1 MAG: Type 4 prepilin-like protein leader peptide-processing enzyme [candidate division TM6 bacterium GW2011_GWF2_33_332]
MLAFRIAFDKSILKARSFCPNCENIITWYDNIPLISWIFLRGKCRNCKKNISPLYPFIEALTTTVLLLVFIKFFGISLFFESSNFVFAIQSIKSFFAYSIFFGALIAATRTDLEALIIPQCFTLWLVPVGFIFSFFNFLEISFLESLIGATSGYLILFLTAKIFKFFTGKNGLGIGDAEMLALIGSFLGIFGVWTTLMISSTIGLLIGVCYLLFTKQGKNTPIPFGPFLALGALIHFLLGQYFNFLI